MKYYIRLLSILFLSLYVQIFSQNTLDQGLSNLGEQISNKFEKRNKTIIAVIEFPDLKGNITDLGRFISEELITRLYLTEKFKVIERQLLNKIISEQKLNLSVIIDPKSAKKLGKLLGVEALVSGTITELSNSLKINARLISTETGEVFSVAATEIKKDDTINNLLTERISNNTTIIDTKIKEKHSENIIYPKPIEVDGFRFEAVKCEREGKFVNCFIQFTNLGNKEVGLDIGGDGWSWRKSNIIDNQGNSYAPKVSYGSNTSPIGLNIKFYSNVTATVCFIVENINLNITSITLAIGIRQFNESVILKNIPIKR